MAEDGKSQVKAAITAGAEKDGRVGGEGVISASLLAYVIEEAETHFAR